jgi:hypothetical protein
MKVADHSQKTATPLNLAFAVRTPVLCFAGPVRLRAARQKQAR